MDLWLSVSGLLGLVVVLASAAIRRLPVSGPLLALGTGAVLGPSAMGVLEVGGSSTVLHLGSEVLLALSVMAVALRYPVRELRDVVSASSVLVTVGMVAMAATTAALAWWLLDLELFEALLLGAVLAPTDPVLASAVVTGRPAVEGLPGRLRRLISTESGVNDGLAWPMVLLGTALVLGRSAPDTAIEVALGTVVAVVLGLALGGGCGWLMRRLGERRDVEQSAFFVGTVALALTVLGVANLVGATGVLAVFVAGLAYNATMGPSFFDSERDVDEGINRILTLPLFVLLGASLPWAQWQSIGPIVAAFAALVLLLRRVPVIVALGPAIRLDVPSSVFVGWFGPIGVAAVFYLSGARLDEAASPTMWAAGVAVIAASTVVHGLTATPGRVLFQEVTARGRAP